MRGIPFAIATAGVMGAIALIVLARSPGSAWNPHPDASLAALPLTLDDPVCRPCEQTTCDAPLAAMALLQHLRARAVLAGNSLPTYASARSTATNVEPVGRRASANIDLNRPFDRPAAFPTLDKGTVTPGLSNSLQAGIARAVRDELSGSVAGIKSCYERSLRHDQTLKGQVLLDVAVGADGQVGSARVVDSTVRDSEMLGCIEKRVRQLHFPALGEDVDVQVPLALVTREE